MDPFTAVGLASALIQITHFGSHVLAKSVEVYKSGVGATARDADVAFVVEKFESLNETLKYSIRASSAASGGASMPTSSASVPKASEQKVLDIAEECSVLADTIIKKLKQVQVGGRPRVWRSIRTALKSVWNKEEIDRMKAKLDELQRQLELGFLVDLRNEIKALGLVQSTNFNELSTDMQRLINALATSSETFVQTVRAEMLHLNAALLDTQNIIREEGQETRRHFELTLRQSIAPAVEPSPQTSAGQAQTDWLNALCATLHFDMIEARQDAIPRKHKETYEWIFDENKSLSDSGPNFVQWLRSDAGIYWISGKAGSGKSTLMNFISGDERLQKALSVWAQNSEVVCASFFFWRSGTDLQKTLDGLLRSVLFQVLKDDDEIAEHILKPLYQPRAKAEHFHWSTRKLMDCFQRLMSQTRRKVFLLVDGVDELDGEHAEFVELLQQYSTGTNTKICLSSRPWRVFKALLGKSPGIRMHELTEKDMIQFVQDNLGVPDIERHKLSNEQTTHQNIANTIINKANGVFIWVTTVVKSVKRGFLAQDSPKTLLARIEALPTEIFDLYVAMLKEVEHVYADPQCRLLETMQSFYTVLDREPHEFRLTTTVVYYMEELIDSQNSRKSVTDRPTKEIKDQIKARIEACTAGLIEVDDKLRLVFAHDTVREFLNRKEIREDLQHRCSVLEFNPIRTLLKAIISLLNAGPTRCFIKQYESRFWLRLSDGGTDSVEAGYDSDGNAYSIETHWNPAENGIEACCSMGFSLAYLLESSEKVADPVLVEALDSALTHCYQIFLQHSLRRLLLHKSVVDFWANRHWSCETAWASDSLCSSFIERCFHRHPNSSGLHQTLPRTLLGAAAVHGLKYFVELRLSQGQEMFSQGLEGENPLAYACIDLSAVLLQYIRGPDHGWSKLEPEMVSMLLRHGADPKARYGPQSPWACFLGRIFRIWDFSHWKWHADDFRKIFQMLLQCGVDLSLDLWIPMSPSSFMKGTIIVRVPAVYILHWCKKMLPIVKGEDPLLNSLVQFGAWPCLDYAQSVSGRFVVDALIVRHEISVCVDWSPLFANVVIHDGSYQLSEIYTFMAGGMPVVEALETMIDLSDWIPYSKTRCTFYGENGERAKNLLHSLAEMDP